MQGKDYNEAYVAQVYQNAMLKARERGEAAGGCQEYLETTDRYDDAEQFKATPFAQRTHVFLLGGSGSDDDVAAGV